MARRRRPGHDVRRRVNQGQQLRRTTEWIESARFDISATANAETSQAQLRVMMQNLLKPAMESFARELSDYAGRPVVDRAEKPTSD